jgi:hypothetical protein
MFHTYKSLGALFMFYCLLDLRRSKVNAVCTVSLWVIEESKGYLQHEMLTGHTAYNNSSRLCLCRELFNQQHQAFLKNSGKHLCCRKLSAFCRACWLRFKQPDCQGATNFLHLTLNGKQISCLQSDCTSLFEFMLPCSFRYTCRLKTTTEAPLTYGPSRDATKINLSYLVVKMG